LVGEAFFYAYHALKHVSAESTGDRGELRITCPFVRPFSKVVFDLIKVFLGDRHLSLLWRDTGMQLRHELILVYDSNGLRFPTNYQDLDVLRRPNLQGRKVRAVAQSGRRR